MILHLAMAKAFEALENNLFDYIAQPLEDSFAFPHLKNKTKQNHVLPSPLNWAKLQVHSCILGLF